MRSVRIPALDRSVPRLGVGCSSIMGRVGRRESLDGLCAAFDGGARYFDVARSYGYGGAERVVGEFLRGRRDECVVVSKAGIVPAMPGVLNRVVLPVARRIARFVPGIQQLSGRRGPALSGVSKGNFAPDAIMGSLETSLRELSIERLDFLLLHDAEVGDLANDRLRRCLDDAVQSGKARAIGLATNIDASLAILAADSAPELAIALVQIATNLEKPDRGRLDPLLETNRHGSSPPFVTTHSSLAVGARARSHFVHWLTQHRDRIEPLQDAGLLAGEPAEDWPRILLGYAMASNPDGVTLCGMLDRRHVASNLETARTVDACATELLALVAAWRMAFQSSP